MVRYTDDRELGFSMERGERQRRVAEMFHEYRRQRLELRQQGYRRGIVICDIVITLLTVGVLFSVASVVWTFTHRI